MQHIFCNYSISRHQCWQEGHCFCLYDLFATGLGLHPMTGADGHLEGSILQSWLPVQPILQQEIQGNILYSMTKQAHMFRQSWPRKYIAYLNSRSWHGSGHNLSRLNLVAGQETFVWKTLYTEPQNSHPEDPNALECCKVSPVMKVPHWRTLSRPTWSQLKCVVRKTGLKTNLLQTLKALPIGHFLPTWCCHARSSLSFISWSGLAKTWTCPPSPSENHPSWMYKLTGSNLVMI